MPDLAAAGELPINDRLSPNCGERRGAAAPDLIVIHYTAMSSAAEAADRLCDPAAEVSAHWMIDLGGAVTRLVPEELRAWHAGAGRWGDVTDVNSRSIGIELQNRGDHPYPEPQMRVLERLLAGIMARWSIPPERVIGHSDMAPARKSDPGPRFDWSRLAWGGLAVWPHQALPDAPAEAFHADAIRFGYDRELTPDLVLRAFRLRFRPWALGPLDATDAAMISDLARRYPVDPPPAHA